MSIKDILVHLTPEAASRPTGSLPYAISMAENLGAHLTGLAFAVDFTKPATFYGGATDEDNAEARERFRNAAEEAAATFSRDAVRTGISYETAMEESLADGAPRSIEAGVGGSTQLSAYLSVKQATAAEAGGGLPRDPPRR